MGDCGVSTKPSCPSLGSLKMERRRLADILPIHKAPLNTPFGDEPSPLHLVFRLPHPNKIPSP
ncbi:hypothetical protein [uncultured Kingella sp.]|uniref:hypothetical protein n=1 Tax=uncultured Kingella sp. TaxID=159270 RepID=UPI002594CFC0|nr:hypothetical protein [uncultured Kingella sp.]